MQTNVSQAWRVVFGVIKIRTGTVQNYSLLGLFGYLLEWITKHLKTGQFLSYQDIWWPYLRWLTIWVSRHCCDVPDCDLGGLCSVETQHKSLRSAAITPPPALCLAHCVILSFWPFILPNFDHNFRSLHLRHFYSLLPCFVCVWQPLWFNPKWAKLFHFTRFR